MRLVSAVGKHATHIIRQLNIRQTETYLTIQVGLLFVALTRKRLTPCTAALRSARAQKSHLCRNFDSNPM